MYTSYPQQPDAYGNGGNGFQPSMGDPHHHDAGPFNLEVQDVLDEIAGKHFSAAKCSNMEQLCTTLEEAFWDYKDLYVAENPDVFPAVTFKQFVEMWRAAQPPFCNFRSSPRDMADWYLKYKRTLNSFGAILLDSALKKCVMVRGIGTSIWGFPKGKAKFVPKARSKEGESEETTGPTLDMEKETAAECAIREVFEELGIDLTERIDENLVIEWNVGKRKAIFFVIPNVPRDTPFAPQLRNEIEEIAWKPVGMLAELNSHYKPLAEKLQKCIADYKPPAPDKESAGKENGTDEAEDDDDDEGRPGHAEGRDAYPGIAFKLRRIKEGCKRCPLCGMWFMPGRQLHMARHLKTCAEMELKQLEGETPNPPPQQQIPPAQTVHQPQPQLVHQPPPDMGPQWAAPPQHVLQHQPSQQQHQQPPQQPIYSPPPINTLPLQQYNPGQPSLQQPPQNHYMPAPQQLTPSPPTTQPPSALQVLQQALHKAVGERIAAQTATQQLSSPPPSGYTPSPPHSFGPPQQSHQPLPFPPAQFQAPAPHYQQHPSDQQQPQPQQIPPHFFHPPPSPQYQQPAPQPQPEHLQQQHHGFMPQPQQQQQQYAPPPQQPQQQYAPPQQPQQQYAPPPQQQAPHFHLEPQHITQQPYPQHLPPAPEPQTTQVGQTRSQILEGLQALLQQRGR